MKVIFINPQGNKNEADLTQEQLERLRKLEGYVVVSPVITIHRKPFVECESCSS